MSKHKFEAGQLVMIRSALGEKWKLQHFSHYDADDKYMSNFVTIGGGAHLFCIPYTPETAHLLDTSNPYEPPKPPQEYEWGQKVEVWSFANKWEQSVFVGRRTDGKFMYILKFDEIVRIVDDVSNIRPLPDDTAAH